MHSAKAQAGLNCNHMQRMEVDEYTQRVAVEICTDEELL